MSVLSTRLPISSLFIFSCFILAMAGCSSGGDSVPFAAMTSPDGTGTSARFSSPSCVTSDGTNLFVADYGNRTIRKVDLATGMVTTFAGTTGKSGTADGTGSAALFRQPIGITTDGVNLYVADKGSNTIRKIAIATAEVTTLAGDGSKLAGSTDGTGTAALFNTPSGIATDGTYLYVADTGNNTIRKVVIATGVVTTLAGSAGKSGTIDRSGSAATFNKPFGITTGNGTVLYVADSGNNSIRKVVTASAAVTTLAVNSGTGFIFSRLSSASTAGSAAKFNNPSGVAVDGTTLYVANSGNGSILKVDTGTGVITPLTVSNQNGTSSYLFSAMTSANWVDSAAYFNQPYSVASAGTNLYVADTGNNTIRTLSLATNAVTTLAGKAP